MIEMLNHSKCRSNSAGRVFG